MYQTVHPMLPPEFDPLVEEWFARKFAAVTGPQALGWEEIRAGRDVLISAPTGSGKTLAAFLVCLDGLIRRARRGDLRVDRRSGAPARMGRQ